MFHTQSSQGDAAPSDHNDISDPIFYDAQIKVYPISLSEPPNSGILAYTANKSLHHGDLRKVLSSNYKVNHKSDKSSNIIPPKSTSIPFSDTVTMHGKICQYVNVHAHATYTVSNINTSSSSSLVDNGENNGLAKSYGRIVFKHNNPWHIYVSGIDSHQMTDFPIVTVGVVVPSQRGDVVAIMH